MEKFLLNILAKDLAKKQLNFEQLKRETLKELKSKDNEEDFLMILEMAVKIIKQKNDQN